MGLPDYLGYLAEPPDEYGGSHFPEYLLSIQIPMMIERAIRDLEPGEKVVFSILNEVLEHVWPDFFDPYDENAAFNATKTIVGGYRNPDSYPNGIGKYSVLFKRILDGDGLVESLTVSVTRDS